MSCTIVERSDTTGVKEIVMVYAPTAATSDMTSGGLDRITARFGGTASTGGTTRETCAPTGAIAVMM